MAEKTGGGILVKPEDPENLAKGLLSLIRDREFRSELARKAYAGVREHYTVEQMAEQTARIFARQRAAVAMTS
jgi:glycosyltransferase involved in cell wall biosynthesis